MSLAHSELIILGVNLIYKLLYFGLTSLATPMLLGILSDFSMIPSVLGLLGFDPLYLSL